MLIAPRTLSLILVFLLVSFPASADDGLDPLPVVLGKIVLLFVWPLGSLVLLVFALSRYTKNKTTAPALLVYLSFGSLAMMYAVIFYCFLDNNSSLLFENPVYTMKKDKAIENYRMLIGAGCILLVSVISFCIFHWRSAKGKSRMTPGN